MLLCCCLISKFIEIKTTSVVTYISSARRLASLYTRYTNRLNLERSRGILIYLALSLRNVPKSLKTVFDIMCV